MISIGFHDHHAASISKHRDVRIVRDEHKLPRLSCLQDLADHGLEDEAVVEVVLRLVNEQWIDAIEQQDGKDGGAFLAGGQRA